MALSLSAEQKSIKVLFCNEDRYLIPRYQRPYSWEYDQCSQLFTDLYSAFLEKNDFFLGNIILAKDDLNKSMPSVVDGQQRLITLWIYCKILNLIFPEINVLYNAVDVAAWEGNERYSKIESDLYEGDDKQYIQWIHELTLDSLKSRYYEVLQPPHTIREYKCKSRIEANALYIYDWIADQIAIKGKDEVKRFVQYFLENVYMLPIELQGKTDTEANSRALTIFETINNRGMNLEDADIFKARLYEKALNVSEEKLFIDQWVDFKTSCSNMGLEVDDVFRFYSHIIRGRQGISSSEKNLRQFFLLESYSPLSNMDYDEIMMQLFLIVDILKRLKEETYTETEWAKWLQILSLYTNNYPMYAIVTYLYVNEVRFDDEFVRFLKSLSRYCYYSGSTTTVKFEIYNIIKQLFLKKPVSDYYVPKISNYDFADPRRLLKGFTLMAFYLSEPEEKALSNYNIDKIMDQKDIAFLDEKYIDDFGNSLLNYLGNYVVTDLPRKRLAFHQKYDFYQDSSISSLKNLLEPYIPFTQSDLETRDTKLKHALVSFFAGKD